VVKAQVYLSDREDVPGFNEVWLSAFKSPPATTIIATANPGFAINNLRIEINTISLATKGKTQREVIRGPERPAFDGWVSAIKAGDLLFLSGLMAVEGGRLIDEARVDGLKKCAVLLEAHFVPVDARRAGRRHVRRAVACRAAFCGRGITSVGVRACLDVRGQRAVAAVGDGGAVAADPRRPRAGRSLGACARLTGGQWRRDPPCPAWAVLMHRTLYLMLDISF
jgi:enamine deaminase RidA (YjgF/YER057c/UK114 family)